MATAELTDLRQPILDSLRDRKTPGRWGIGTAAVYVSQLRDAVQAPNFPEMLKDAEQKLTYCHPDMVLTDIDPASDRPLDLITLEFDDGSRVRVGKPSAKAKRSPTEGAVMEFEGVITTVRQDRDGDILEPKGAIVDPKLPLLWQHWPDAPIGKLLKVTQQNGKRVKGEFAIADTALGCDAAQLVEFGALRISHGFMPLEYEEIKKGKDEEDDDFIGWHITKFEIMEVSLVSVPSNVDAVITAQSRGKLTHPAVKAWAKGIADKRAVQVQGGKCSHDTIPVEETLLRREGTFDKFEAASEESATERCFGYVKVELTNEGKELLSQIEAKSGRALSKQNEQRIKDARDDVAEIVGMTDIPRAAKALATGAAARLNEVLRSVEVDEDGDKQTSRGEAFAWLATGAEAGELREARELIDARLAKMADQRLGKLLGV